MKNNAENLTIDVMKFIMAILVVGIHTQPFGFNVWLDRGFGILTRLCVPFFFITSAYFFFSGNKPLWKYLFKLIQLYIVWSIIYLPFDIAALKNRSILEIINLFFWNGNLHSLWYLWGTVIATLIVYLLQRKFSDVHIIIITFLFFVVGYMGSTCASTNVGRYCTGITNVLGIRNGLFYGAIYVALGMYMAKHNLDEGKTKRYLLGFVVSMLLLTLEGLFCVLVLKTNSTILWISAVPASYTFVRLCFSIKIRIKPETALGLRKLSTIIYLSHDIFIKLIEDYLQYIQLFAAVTILSVLFGILLIGISKRCCLVKKLFCL